MIENMNDPGKGDVRPCDPEPTNTTNGSSIAQWKPPGTPSSLARFSLIDKTAELDAFAAKQEPLLGQICLTTQATVFYAKPNTGKTLLTLWLLREAVAEGRIEGGKCFYIAADDNPSGVLEKQLLLKPLGVHVIAPGLNGFSTAMLRTEIEAMILDGSAAGSLIIIDTLKKFADLMDKKSGSAFGDLARRYILAGGTLIGLAHTNKRTDKDGRPIYAGTSDILDDFDCGYTIEELPQSSMPGDRVVQFECLKRRGDVVQQVAYRYRLDGQPSYAELLDSVREVGAEELDQVRVDGEQERDAEAISAISDCIRDGVTAKQELKCEAAKRSKIGRHKISDVIDRYTGTDPNKHLWDYGVFRSGRREYRLLSEPISAGPRPDPDEVF